MTDTPFTTPRGVKNPRNERRYITDLSRVQTLTRVNADGARASEELPRYGVWGLTAAKGKSEVLETHNDLALMQHEHDVPDERVVQIPHACALEDLTGLESRAVPTPKA
jgi:hypothetical protein